MMIEGLKLWGVMFLFGLVGVICCAALVVASPFMATQYMLAGGDQ